MSSMYDMYKICHIYERIFAWMQILYIICGNNILEIHYNTESYTPLHNVPYNTESCTLLHNVHYNTASYTPLHNVSYNAESYTPLHNVFSNIESYTPLHNVSHNAESYTSLHNVSYNTESYTPLHNVPDISSLIKGTGDSNRLSCPILLIISAWISTNVHTHIDEYVIINNTKS